MTLAAGTKLGSYEIVAPLGAGGMGEVYRARDTRLGRDVAIKLLPAAFSANSDRLHRFEQEARSASALNHPNIVTIYELGQDGSSHYIAMELVEGKTLRELLVSGLLPMRKAIEFAAQVAEGLTKAHEAGITHRDLKPENLMVSQDGFVKILDFGLAKLMSTSEERMDMRTLSSLQTQPGLVLGTLGYMSPEQVRGDRLDFRSDQFSFGLVLYEMVTGKHPFQRGTAANTLVAILQEQAEPIGVQTRAAPAPLCWAIERCLAKEPDKRYVSTRDLARELAAIRDCFSEKPVRRVETRPANLPVSRTGFVGREREVAAAKELVQRQDVRLVTVTGPGGIGKTRLAVEVAGGLIERFPGGIHFVPLSPLSDPDLVASAIVQTLGIREEGGQSPLQMLKENLQDSLRAPMLLLLDNFEHVVQAAPTVAELLAMAPNLKILVTSRAALHVYGEHEFPVPPLALPDPRSMPSVEMLSECPAVALFVQRAGAAKPDFELNRENAPAVTEICSRLDGLPLAIELAAARVKVLSPSSMLARLASRLQLLTGGARDLPLRQQTLRAAMDWSYDLLNAAEQKLFRRLSVFVGGCNLEGVEAVCDTKGDLDLDLLDGMASMVDKSLVQQVEQAKGESRFVMLETIREYALEKLEVSGEEALTKRAHAAYCLVLAEEGAPQFGGAEERGWLERFVLEQDNFRAALDWLTETGNADWSLRLADALLPFWFIQGLDIEGHRRFTAILGLPEVQARTKLRARGLLGAGSMAAYYTRACLPTPGPAAGVPREAKSDQRPYAHRNVEAGCSLLEDALRLFRQLGDRPGTLAALNNLAVVSRDAGDYAGARSSYTEVLRISQEIGDQVSAARAMSNLADALRCEGNYAAARSLYEECFEVFQRLGDRAGMAWSLNHQGDAAREQGDAATASSLYGQALGIFRELDDRPGIARSLADLGGLAFKQGDYVAARTLCAEALGFFHKLSKPLEVIGVLAEMAACASQERRWDRTLRLASAALCLRQKEGVELPGLTKDKLQRALESARKGLHSAAAARVWMEGSNMSLTQVIEYARAGEAG